IAIICLSAIGCWAQDANKRFLPMDKSLVALSSLEGRKLLTESKAQEAFWSLSQFYSPQPDLGSCSVASCTMVLNSLPIERPLSKQHNPFKLFTPGNFFTAEVEEILKTKKASARQVVSGAGMTLDQLSRVLSTFPVSVECKYGSESNIEQFRMIMSDALS